MNVNEIKMERKWAKGAWKRVKEIKMKKGKKNRKKKARKSN